MGNFIKNYFEGFGIGWKQGFTWYKERIESSKWWIIMFVLDMILLPVKFAIIFPISFISTVITYLFLEIKYRLW